MKAKFLLLAGMLIFFSQTQSLQAFGYSAGLQAGYYNGPGLYLNGELTDFATGFPFKMRLGVGYTKVQNPGKALDARSIFINNNTNGSPEKDGWMWDFRMDLMYRVHWLDLSNAFVYAGPRYAAFTANFNFVNGNENFDVVSEHWGWGLGLNTSFAMSRTLDLVLDGGLDYFFSSTLTGHDTSYSPDNENVNAREDYEFKDADEAINQPRYNLRLMMGVNYHF